MLRIGQQLKGWPDRGCLASESGENSVFGLATRNSEHLEITEQVIVRMKVCACARLSINLIWGRCFVRRGGMHTIWGKKYIYIE